MSKTKGVNKNKLIGVLIILVGILAVFAYMILYNTGVTIKKTTTTEVLGKFANVQKKGGEFELTQKNIDELSNLYFAKAITKGNITLNGVNVEILNDEFLIKAPISYKNLHLLFSSKGKVSVLNGKVTYDAENFKIGKLKLPKKFVVSQIIKLNNKSLDVEGNLIKIDPSMFPFKITSLEIKDNKILGMALKQGVLVSFDDLNKMSGAEIDKQIDILKQKMQSSTVLMGGEAEKAKLKEILDTLDKAKGKSIQEKKQIISDSINQIDGAIGKATDSDKKKELEKIRVAAEKAKQLAAEKEKIWSQQNNTKSAALTKVQNELGGAYSQVGSSKGKQMISIMQSTMSKLASSSSYNSSGDQASVISIYSTLDSQGKNEFKNALAANVDSASVSVLRQVFGI